MIDLTQPTWKHAGTRFQCVTDGVIHQLQSDFFAGRSLEDSIPGVSADQAAVMVAESLEADVIHNLNPQELLNGAVNKRRNCDFLRATLAELIFQVVDTARQNQIGDAVAARNWWAGAMASLEEAALSPTASPLLEYEEIFFELAQNARDKTNKEAIEWMKRGLAHNLHFENGSNAVSNLRDLADLHLQVGRLDQGLKILTAVLRQDPTDIWTYNIIAITFDRFGLARLGSQGIQRGLELIKIKGDEEGLRSQFKRCLKDMEASELEELESEVTPLILARFQEALNLDFEAGQPIPVPLLCRELVPDLEQVPIKRPLTSHDFPLPRPEDILTELLNNQHKSTKGKSRHRHKKRGKS